MRQLYKNVFIELVWTPFTMIPVVLGSCGLLIAFAIGSSQWALLGLGSILMAIAIGATNLFLNWENVFTQAAKRWRAKLEAKKNADLDILQASLVETKGTEDENALANLRLIYNSFSDSLEKGQISKNVPPYMIELIDELFESCISQLRFAVHLHEQEKGLQGELKKKAKAQRQDIVDKVKQSVEQLNGTVAEVRALRLKSDTTQLSRLQEKLQQQLNTAKIIQQETESIGAENDYNEYTSVENIE